MPPTKIAFAKQQPSVSWSSNLLNWYEAHKRDLPWRDVHNPYFTWLSEVILQQTRIDQGTAYYHRFIEAYPTITDLAMATEQEVLRHWQGLGYYSRARSLHTTAKQVVADFDGQMPTDYHALLKLKGIGPYTAAAIASMAGGQDVVCVDGNVYRVLARSFGIDFDIADTKARSLFQDFGMALLPIGRASDFNQGLMDLGATVCTPRQPNCVSCPVAYSCYARTHNLIEALPVKSKKIKQQVRYLHYVALLDHDGLWLRMRNGPGIWQGLWELPVLESAKDIDWCELSGLEIPSEQKNLWQFVLPNLPIQQWIAPKHQLTHQTILSSFYVLNLPDLPQSASLKQFLEQSDYQYILNQDLDAIPKPVLLSRFLGAVSLEP